MSDIDQSPTDKISCTNNTISTPTILVSVNPIFFKETLSNFNLQYDVDGLSLFLAYTTTVIGCIVVCFFPAYSEAPICHMSCACLSRDPSGELASLLSLHGGCTDHYCIHIGTFLKTCICPLSQIFDVVKLGIVVLPCLVFIISNIMVQWVCSIYWEHQ